MTHRMSFRKLARFISTHYRFLLFLLCLLFGVTIGCLVYADISGSYGDIIVSLTDLAPVGGGVANILWAVLESALFLLILLAALLLSGLSVCGAPVVWLVPVVYGLGLGLTEAHLFAQGAEGVFLAAALVIPHSMVAIAVLLMGCSESFRMTLLLAGQVLPNGARCGGLWQDFKRYFLRFLVFFGLSFLAAAVDVLLKMLLL